MPTDFGLFDFSLHTAETETDVNETFDKMYREMFGIEPIKDGRFSASFGHLMGGYDAGYYGYLWSEVYSDDLFSRFTQEGIFDKAVGGELRRIIIEKGAMEEPTDLLKEFLGREPSSIAFFKKLGV